MCEERRINGRNVRCPLMYEEKNWGRWTRDLTYNVSKGSILSASLAFPRSNIAVRTVRDTITNPFSFTHT
jgi:hypothetical protein